MREETRAYIMPVLGPGTTRSVHYVVLHIFVTAIDRVHIKRIHLTAIKWERKSEHRNIRQGFLICADLAYTTYDYGDHGE